MKVLIQRVDHASVTVNEEIIGAINRGILLFVGIDKADQAEAIQRMANKVVAYRIFSDSNGKMNLNVADIDGDILVVSQFTLSADTGKGLRPSFSSAAPPELANTLYQQFVDCLKKLHAKVATGSFAANMHVSLLNNGPVTFLLQV